MYNIYYCGQLIGRDLKGMIEEDARQGDLRDYVCLWRVGY